jgi:hypothetical protein
MKITSGVRMGATVRSASLMPHAGVPTNETQFSPSESLVRHSPALLLLGLSRASTDSLCCPNDCNQSLRESWRHCLQNFPVRRWVEHIIPENSAHKAFAIRRGFLVLWRVSCFARMIFFRLSQLLRCLPVPAIQRRRWNVPDIRRARRCRSESQAEPRHTQNENPHDRHDQKCRPVKG